MWPVLCAATGGLDSAHDAGLRDVGPAGRCGLLVLLWIWRLPLPNDLTTTNLTTRLLVVRFRAAGWPDGRGHAVEPTDASRKPADSGRCPALASPVPVTDWHRARPAGRPCGCRPAAMSWCATCPGTRRGHVRAADPPIEKRHAPAPHAGLHHRSPAGSTLAERFPGTGAAQRAPARRTRQGRHQTPQAAGAITRRERWRWFCTGWTFYPHEARPPRPPVQGAPGGVRRLR